MKYFFKTLKVKIKNVFTLIVDFLKRHEKEIKVIIHFIKFIIWMIKLIF